MCDGLGLTRGLTIWRQHIRPFSRSDSLALSTTLPLHFRFLSRSLARIPLRRKIFVSLLPSSAVAETERSEGRRFSAQKKPPCPRNLAAGISCAGPHLTFPCPAPPNSPKIGMAIPVDRSRISVVARLGRDAGPQPYSLASLFLYL